MKDVRQISRADIREVKAHKKAHLPLLLLGGEEEAMIDRYLARGTLYVLSIGAREPRCASSRKRKARSK